MHTNEIEECSCTRLDIDPARINITATPAEGTTFTLTRVPCGLCAGCGAPIFRQSVSDAVESLCSLFAVKNLGEIERSYSDMVKR